MIYSQIQRVSKSICAGLCAYDQHLLPTTLDLGVNRRFTRREKLYLGMLL